MARSAIARLPRMLSLQEFIADNRATFDSAQPDMPSAPDVIKLLTAMAQAITAMRTQPIAVNAQVVSGAVTVRPVVHVAPAQVKVAAPVVEMQGEPIKHWGVAVHRKNGLITSMTIKAAQAAG